MMGWEVLQLIMYKAVNSRYHECEDREISLDLRTQPLRTEFPVLLARGDQDGMIIGIKSNSFWVPTPKNADPPWHNLFLEWDDK